MRPISFCFFFLLITNWASSQTPENADSIIKKNDIIKETIVFFSYKNKLSEDSFPITLENLYNEQGKLIANKRIFKGVSYFIESFKYDEKNKLVKAFFYGSQNKILGDEVYEYDSLGREIGSHSFGFKGTEPPDDTIKTQGKVRKIYNGKNQLIELFYTLEADGILHKSQQFAYTSDGKMDKSFYFTPEGELYLSYNYLYKKNGDITIFTRYKASQFGKSSEQYFNTKKQLVKNVSYYGKGSTTKYSYNTDGTLSEKYEITGNEWKRLERHFYAKQ